MKKSFFYFFIFLLCFHSTSILAEDYVTINPSVLSQNCAYCKIAKVIVNNNETKVLINVAAQRSLKGPWIRFSKWTILIPYKNEAISILRDQDLEIIQPESSDPTYLSVWTKYVDKQHKKQNDMQELLPNSFIKDLGKDLLETKYIISGKTGEFFSFWLTFPPLTKGIEEIAIMELTRDGFEWLGIKINNPDTSPKTDWNEYTLKEHWKNNGMLNFEGIYESTSPDNTKYKLAVLKNSNSNQIELIYLSGSNSKLWNIGDIKAYLTETGTENIFRSEWYMIDKTISFNQYISFERGIMKVVSTTNRTEELYLKLYPTVASNEGRSQIKSSGTGFAISEDGLVVTNQHVINGANSITIRGLNEDFSKTYNAVVLVEDKNNDIAILKIKDERFSSLSLIPYVLKEKSIDVGTSIFVLGYPLRASMGDEVKLTNGIISSKSGYKGDVTSYQISAPVQPGNSGGPLFDNLGNIVGIVNAKLTGAENASYAIKSTYLINLIESLQTPITLQPNNTIINLPLTEKVKIIKKYTYIIEAN